MHVAYLLHDDTKDCVILTHRPLWLSFQNHESVWMVPGAISADDEPIARGSIPPPTKKIRPDQAERGSEPAEAEPKPRRKKIRWCFGSSARWATMRAWRAQYDFKLTLAAVEGGRRAIDRGRAIRHWPLVLVRGDHPRLEAWQSASLRRPDRSRPRSRLW